MIDIIFKLLNIIVILGGIFLLQFHGIRFWIQAVDIHTGIWWSVLIELVNFWAWFQVREIGLRKFLIKFIAICTTLLLLVGPIYIVSQELILEYNSSSQDFDEFKRKKDLLQTEFDQKKEQSDRLLSIIEKKENGYITFNRLNVRMQEISDELNKLQKPETSASVSGQKILTILLQIFSVLIFQLAIILAITKFANKDDEIDISSYSDLLKRKEKNKGM